MISHGRSGETSSASIVPVSFSRVSEMAVIRAEMIVRTNAISPGTKRFLLSRVGLNRMRVTGTMRAPAPTPSTLPAPPASPASAAHWFTTACAYACNRLPVFGSVVSVMISNRAGLPRPKSAAKS